MTDILNALNSFEKLSDALDESNVLASSQVKDDELEVDPENEISSEIPSSSSSPAPAPTQTTTDSLYYVTDEIDKPTTDYSSTTPLDLTSSIPSTIMSTTTSERENNNATQELSWKNLMKAGLLTTVASPPALAKYSTPSLTTTTPEVASKTNSADEYYEESAESQSQEDDYDENDEYEELVKLMMSTKVGNTTESLVELNSTLPTSTAMVSNKTAPKTYQLLNSKTIEIDASKEEEDAADDDENDEVGDGDVDEVSVTFTSPMITGKEPTSSTVFSSTTVQQARVMHKIQFKNWSML